MNIEELRKRLRRSDLVRKQVHALALRTAPEEYGLPNALSETACYPVKHGAEVRDYLGFSKIISYIESRDLCAAILSRPDGRLMFCGASYLKPPHNGVFALSGTRDEIADEIPHPVRYAFVELAAKSAREKIHLTGLLQI